MDNTPQPDWAAIEAEGEAMVDWYMSQPKTVEEEQAQERMIDVWFPELKSHIDE